MVSLYVLIILAVTYSFFNGFNDSSNIVATMISSRAIPPRLALTIIAVAEFSGPFLFGVAVARTIGDGLIKHGIVSISMLLAALAGAITWSLVTWFLAIPSSSSHALIGGMIGAVAMGAGFSVILIGGVLKVLLALILSPLLGLGIGYGFTRLTLFLARNSTPKINLFFKRAQIITGMTLGLSHGANDSQKSMGIIVLGLIAVGWIKDFQVPLWVMALSALGIGAGTATGAWRLIKTIGGKFYKIRPIHGFATQASSALVVLSAALLGGPVSTSQVVSSAILGVGSAERLSKVRWNVAQQIVIAWLLTIPVTMLMAAAYYWLIKLISGG